MTTNHFRKCDTPGCDRQAEPGEKLCIMCAVEAWVDDETAENIAAELDDPGNDVPNNLYRADKIMPCDHPEWAATSNGSPLVASTQHCRMCSGEIAEVKVERVYKNVY